MFVHLRVCLPTPSPPSVPCLIIISSCLCLPRSLMMTGMAGLPESQVPTLMSPCLTPLLSAQVSPHPCPSDLQRPRWLLGGWGGSGTELEAKERGDSLFSFLSPLSLFIYDISSMTGDVAWPQGRTCGPQRAGDGDPSWVLWLSFWLQDNGPAAHHSEGVSWVKVWLNESYHRIARKVGPRGVSNGEIWERGRGGVGGLTH